MLCLKQRKDLEISESDAIHPLTPLEILSMKSTNKGQPRWSPKPEPRS